MTATYEDLKAQAVKEGWSNRKIKDALFEAGMNDRRAELIAAVRAIHPVIESAPVKVAVAVTAAVVTTPAPVAAEPIKLADGAVIWCDAAENTVRKVINSFGRLATFDNGGYRVAIKSGDLVERHYNTVCPDQFAGECFSILKAVELAVKHGLKAATIRNDRIGGFMATTKRDYKGTTYLWLAKKMAAENNLAVTFDCCTGEENEADHASRSE